jgi:hypothetical protein
MLVLPFVDLLVFEGRRGKPGDRRRWWGFVSFCSCLGDHEQTFHGNAARRACALRLVAERRIRWRDIANLIPFVLISALASA